MCRAVLRRKRSLWNTDVSVSAGYDAAAVKKELGNLSCSVGPGAGSYAITKDGFAANANYTVDFVGKNYEVRALPVTVTPNANQKKTYGDADPAAYGYSVSADLSADLLAKAEAELGSGLLTRESGNTVKTYPFKLNGSYPNYVISLQSGSFEIVKREVTLNLLSASKPMTAQPPFRFRISATALTIWPAGILCGLVP